MSKVLSYLKPCPFCGGAPFIHEVPPHTHGIATFMPDSKGECFIECRDCTCAISAKDRNEAIKLWNKRRKGDKKRVYLAPCPVCGARPILHHHVGYNEYKYACPVCIAFKYKQPIVKGYRWSKKKAAQDWNKAVEEFE